MPEPVFRPARPEDLGFIVHLIHIDTVGESREQPGEPLDPRYVAAFAKIAADENQRLVIAELAGEPIGTLQLSFIPGITRLGESRCLVEAVHVAPAHRSKGYGGAMLEWAIGVAREHGCGLVQLTSNKARTDAHRFYRRLGFVQTHEGFKLKL